MSTATSLDVPQLSSFMLLSLLLPLPPLFPLGLGLVLFFAIAKMWWRADAAVERLVDRLPPPEQVLNLAYPPSRIELLPYDTTAPDFDFLGELVAIPV